MTDTCVCEVTDKDGNLEPCGQPATGTGIDWDNQNFYLACSEHESQICRDLLAEVWDAGYQLGLIYGAGSVQMRRPSIAPKNLNPYKEATD